MTEQPARSFVKGAIWYALMGVFILVALVAGRYVWKGWAPLEQRAGPPEPLTIAANTSYVGTGLIFIAQAKGYFAREGLNVTLQPFTTGKAALDAALAGRAALATVADIPLMFAVTKGQPVSIVATIFTGEKDLGIVGRKDQGFSAPMSLNGKRIGVTLGTSGHFMLDGFLIRQRLSTDDVTLRDLQPEELSEALVNGDIDVAATWEPYLSAVRTRLGGNATIVYSEGIYELPFTIAGARDYVVNHAETVKKLLRALVRAEQLCKEEPEAARKVIAGAINMSLETLQELWPSYRFNVTLNQSLLLVLEDETRWAIKNELTARSDVPNYLHHLYLDGLRAVKPESVTVIH
jgi:NitT/TauT family transport system substrate-binding protein